MKEAIVSRGPLVKVIDASIPEPGPDEVLTKVVVAGANQKDWKIAEWGGPDGNQGDDLAGIVQAVGSDVNEFRPGDRVAAFHQIMTPGGSYAEYAISPAHMTFHIPKEVEFEAAATIPLTAMTAACALFQTLGLPGPWNPPENPLPLVIYGAAGAVGAYAVQLASHCGIHPLICVAGRGASFVETLIDKSKGDIVVDYRKDVVQGIKSALPSGVPLLYAFDAVTGKGSYENICQVLSNDGGKLATVLGIPEAEKVIPKGVWWKQTEVGATFSSQKELGFAWSRLFSLGLASGWLKPHPHEVVPGGLNGVQEALVNLKHGKASAVKYVFRIAET